MQGTSTGLTFLNHNGGALGCSGTADGGIAFVSHMNMEMSADVEHSFGASLSYASSDGISGASSSQVLSNTTIKDDAEIIILSDKSCDDGGCGYARPGGVAYRALSQMSTLLISRLNESQMALAATTKCSSSNSLCPGVPHPVSTLICRQFGL